MFQLPTFMFSAIIFNLIGMWMFSGKFIAKASLDPQCPRYRVYFYDFSMWMGLFLSFIYSGRLLVEGGYQCWFDIASMFVFPVLVYSPIVAISFLDWRLLSRVDPQDKKWCLTSWIRRIGGKKMTTKSTAAIVVGNLIIFTFFLVSFVVYIIVMAKKGLTLENLTSFNEACTLDGDVVYLAAVLLFYMVVMIWVFILNALVSPSVTCVIKEGCVISLLTFFFYSFRLSLSFSPQDEEKWITDRYHPDILLVLGNMSSLFVVIISCMLGYVGVSWEKINKIFGNSERKKVHSARDGDDDDEYENGGGGGFTVISGEQGLELSDDSNDEGGGGNLHEKNKKPSITPNLSLFGNTGQDAKKSGVKQRENQSKGTGFKRITGNPPKPRHQGEYDDEDGDTIIELLAGGGGGTEDYDDTNSNPMSDVVPVEKLFVCVNGQRSYHRIQALSVGDIVSNEENILNEIKVYSKEVLDATISIEYILKYLRENQGGAGDQKGKVGVMKDRIPVLFSSFLSPSLLDVVFQKAK